MAKKNELTEEQKKQLMPSQLNLNPNPLTTKPKDPFSKTETPKQPMSIDTTKAGGQQEESQRGQPEVFRDTQGNISAVKSPQGVLLPNLSPQAQNELLNIWARQDAILKGGNIAGTGAGTASGSIGGGIVEASQQELQQAQQSTIQNLGMQFPVSRNLNPEISPFEGQEGLSLAGANMAVLSRLAYDRQNLAEQEVSGISPETLRSAALSKVEERVIKRGLSKSEKFGALVEAIPVFGSAVGKWVNSVTTPSETVDELKRGITKQKEFATDMAEMAGQGILSPDVAVDQINQAELELQRMESEIRKVSIYSATLRANPEEINNIETEILTARAKLLRAKLKIAAGGQQMQPNEYQIYAALEKLDKY